jgi:hypothetical protein
LYLVEHLRVAQYDHAVFCTCDGHVQSARVFQEADARSFVTAYAGDDDVVLLSALVSVNRRDLDFLVIIGVF